MGYRDPSVEFDVSDDWPVWDNRAPVTFVSRRTAGDRSTILVDAVKRAVGRAEVAASKGVYTRDDVNFSIPRALLPAGVEPKPRDAVVERDGTEWTVLRAALNGFRGAWVLTTRNLRIVEALHDEVEVQQPRYVRDATGARRAAWATAQTVYGRLQPVTAAVSEERGLRGLRVTHTLFLDREVEVSNEYRVKVAGRVYEVRGYRNSHKIDQLPEMDVELVP